MNSKVSNELTLGDEDVSMLCSKAATNAPLWWGQLWEISVLSTQFCYEPKLL